MQFNNFSQLAIWIFSTFAILASPSQACRYNVRDVGFVDLGRSTYRLELQGNAESASQRTRLKALFPAGNIHLTMADVSDESSAIAVLRSPDGRTVELLEGQGGEPGASALHGACVSELSQSLVDRLIDCHSIVLLVEGAFAPANEEARKAIDEAIQKTVATRSLWPKPIDNPPEVVVIRGESNEMLLWSLGMLKASKTPQVVVLFGRGRRLGDVLTLGDLKTGQLTRRLSIISIDCECDFNIAAMIGPMIPHAWTEEHEARATRSLGFDPGMPLVQVEVEQILARWPLGERREQEEPSFGDPMLGYQEIELPTGEPEPEEEVDVAEPRQPNPTSELATQQTTPQSNRAEFTEDAPDLPWRVAGWTVAGVLLVSLLGSGIVWLRRGH